MSDNTPQSMNELMSMFGYVEGSTRTEDAYVREAYQALANGASDVYIISREDADESFIELTSSIASDDTLIFVVDGKTADIRRKMNYRNESAKSHAKVTYGSVRVFPITVGAHIRPSDIA